MAEIVLGIGVSHGTMLGAPPENWTSPTRRATDQKRQHFFKNKEWSYDALEAHRAPENLEQYLAMDVRTSRFAACHKALDQLIAIYEEVKPDVVVIIGNDHKECFPKVIPTFGVHWGKTIENGVIPGFEVYSTPEPKVYPGLPELGLHLIAALKADNFDVASISDTPERDDGRKIISHAYAFVYHKLMKDNPPPTVPVVLNTFYPPNQPTMKRCIEFGHSLTRAIRSWDSDKRVAIIASGGLSHFIADEETDHFIIDALLSDRVEKLTELDEMTYQSGTSETKNWVPVVVAMRELGFKMNLVDYVPLYRSPAGNGQGMTFAYWRE